MPILVDVDGNTFDMSYQSLEEAVASVIGDDSRQQFFEKLKFFDEEINDCNKVTVKYTLRLKDIVKTPIIKKKWHQSCSVAENVSDYCLSLPMHIWI